MELNKEMRIVSISRIYSELKTKRKMKNQTVELYIEMAAFAIRMRDKCLHLLKINGRIILKKQKKFLLIKG